MNATTVVKKIREAEWRRYKEEDWEYCRIGKINFYRFPDGHASCSYDQIWISALFVSAEAAASWAYDWDNAEKLFRELNPPDGKGSNFVPRKGTGAA
jgi:hypothetical protein